MLSFPNSISVIHPVTVSCGPGLEETVGALLPLLLAGDLLHETAARLARARAARARCGMAHCSR
jgi:hypothetical protein